MLLALCTLLVCAADPAPAPTPEKLLLDAHVRQAFVARWAPAFVRVRFRAPTLPGQDEGFMPLQEVLGVVVQGPGGASSVLAPEGRLAGVASATLTMTDGAVVAATVVHPSDLDELPLARLQPLDASALASRLALAWAPEDALVPGVRGWGIEWPAGVLRGADPPPPTLVDTELTEKVEYPLERFWYVPVRQADGMALLDASGRLLCVVFRQVPGAERLSLCAPRATVAEVPERDR